MRNFVFIPIELINKSSSQGWLRSLSYFVRMKSLYKNNTHYGFTLRSLSEKLKCSPACLSFHLKVLAKKELVRFHSGNITFTGLRKLQWTYKLKNIAVPINFKNQYDFLRCQIIRFNLSAQEFNIRKAERQNKSLRPRWRRKQNEKPCDNYPGLSAKGTGGLFGLSKESGSRIRKKLKKFGLLAITRKYATLFKGLNELHYWNLKSLCLIPAHSFFNSGEVVVEKRPCMKYIGRDYSALEDVVIK